MDKLKEVIDRAHQSANTLHAQIRTIQKHYKFFQSLQDEELAADIVASTRDLLIWPRNPHKCLQAFREYGDFTFTRTASGIYSYNWTTEFHGIQVTIMASEVIATIEGTVVP